MLFVDFSVYIPNALRFLICILYTMYEFLSDAMSGLGKSLKALQMVGIDSHTIC